MKKIVGIFAIIAIVAIALDGRFNLIYAQAPAQGTTDSQAVAPGASGRIFNLPEDLHIAAGFKTWFNNWHSTGKVFLNNVPGTIESDGKGYIPTLGVRYKDFFLSASGMFGQNYALSDIDFPSTSFKNAMRMQRKEVDVNLGYYVLPWLAISAGYKGVFINFSCLVCGSNGQKIDYDYQGPTAGISLNVPIPEWNEFPAGFSIYGNAGGGYMNAEQTQTFPIKQKVRLVNHAWYSNFEGGIAYKAPPLPFALTVGYRYQRIDGRFMSRITKNPALSAIPNGEEDITKGAVVGITFVF